MDNDLRESGADDLDTANMCRVEPAPNNNKTAENAVQVESGDMAVGGITSADDDTLVTSQSQTNWAETTDNE